jgi:hypothetical protein
MMKSAGPAPFRSVCARSLVALTAFLLGSAGFLGAQQSNSISPGALAQIQSLLLEKESRTPTQQKIDSNLLYSLKIARGQAVAPGVPTLDTGLSTDLSSNIEVDIAANVDDALLSQLQSLGATIQSSHPAYRTLRATTPLAQVELIAGLPQVIFVQPKQESTTHRLLAPSSSALASVSRSLLPALRPGFAQRAAAIRAQLAALLGAPRAAGKEAILKINTSEGDVTHRAALARTTFGVNGTGVKVGVLSDGVNSLASLQGSGDLPAGVTVLPGQAGNGDEGSAMLEIVYDLAPGAQLYFATANPTIAQFAQNIKDLRTAGCDIIVDDVIYFVETPFQKGQTPAVVSNTNGGIVTEAINTVTAAGAMYFTSAGNEGGLDAGSSGTWEGDFADGGPVGAPIGGTGNLHDFDPSASVSAFDTLTASANRATLHWSDPLGGSSNDYDLFVLNSTGTTVLSSSTNLQNGTQDPWEQAFSTSSGNRIVIVKRTGAAARFLHLCAFRGKLTFGTAGEVHGHAAPPAANAFGVAATPASTAFGPGYPTGPYPSPFNAGNTIELFSSDGPRRYFFNSDSSAITPGNFSSTGGELRNKPDITAADGVMCAAPGFNPFFGTSAAAPHAGAIAALVKSSRPSLTPAQISTILTSTATDIMAAGIDRDSGRGILDAYSAVSFTAVSKFFTMTPCRVIDTRRVPGTYGGPALMAGASRTFVLASQCGLPATPRAVAINVTVTQPTTGPGRFTVYTGGSTLPATSTLNYNNGQTRSNNAVVPLGTAGDMTVFCGQGSGTAHLVVDVVGYFQ